MKSANSIKIFIADDHPIVRKTLSTYLARESHIQVLGESGDTENLVAASRKLQPNILLLDANMPGPDVVNVVQQLQDCCPDTDVLVLSASKKRSLVLDLLKAGVKGYVLKEDDPSQLLEAIEAVASGEEWFSPSVASVLVSSIRAGEKKSHTPLTKREKEVLQLMVTGVGNEEIAEQLYIATNTVKNHARSIFRKLDVHTRVEAVVYALDHNLVDANVELSE